MPESFASLLQACCILARNQHSNHPGAVAGSKPRKCKSLSSNRSVYTVGANPSVSIPNSSIGPNRWQCLPPRPDRSGFPRSGGLLLHSQLDKLSDCADNLLLEGGKLESKRLLCQRDVKRTEQLAYLVAAGTISTSEWRLASLPRATCRLDHSGVGYFDAYTVGRATGAQVRPSRLVSGGGVDVCPSKEGQPTS